LLLAEQEAEFAEDSGGSDCVAVLVLRRLPTSARAENQAAPGPYLTVRATQTRSCPSGANHGGNSHESGNNIRGPLFGGRLAPVVAGGACVAGCHTSPRSLDERGR
jgi:hypothetical protein